MVSAGVRQYVSPQRRAVERRVMQAVRGGTCPVIRGRYKEGFSRGMRQDVSPHLGQDREGFSRG
jgi:hypothetical protein